MTEQFPLGQLAQAAPAQLVQWMAEVQPLVGLGHLPQYVPELAQVNPETLALAVQPAQAKLIGLGDVSCRFSLMSLMKPFLLLFVLEEQGADIVFDRVGMLPSDQSFHSLKQLAADRGHPRNPMLNSGALSLVELLPGRNGTERCRVFCQWLQQKSGIALTVDQTMLASVRELPNDTNRALAQMLKNAGSISSMAKALDTYNQICCLAVTVSALAQLGLLLAVRQDCIQRRSQRIVNALMLTSGVYEVSGEWALRMGLPIKSGVSGGILAIVPGEGTIALYSPAIDDAGNSVAGACLLEKIIQNFDLSLF
ncbi:glutaminase A [filamentous cyanobacterium LEGE 11480]|uniref:Glutaminase n=1 Tax=Romeriopsis navalis LEGE 11480 TaxID=2777977 RepID=A0A928Z5R2_9CYAN|nr:glutaminase A [Romeriopsis navalis]MBE9032252.1 glutaminase A [Romeriopsis navalis LEGE 11480]